MSPSPAHRDKSEMRALMRKARRSLSEHERQRFDESIDHSIIRMIRHEGAVNIGAYLAFDGEPDIESALRSLSGAGHSIYLPVLNDELAKPGFEFRHWLGPGTDMETSLARNSFGIREPRSGAAIKVNELAILFIPLVACDRTGKRLGMGGGYYDRVLAELSDNPLPRRIGIAYELQKLESIPSEPHDIPLHEVLTESGVFTCTG